MSQEQKTQKEETGVTAKKSKVPAGHITLPQIVVSTDTKAKLALIASSKGVTLQELLTTELVAIASKVKVSF